MVKIKELISQNRSLLNGSLFSLFSFVNQGISFLLLIILAKFILPDDYGQLSLFNTCVTFLSYFIALSTTGYESISYFQKDSIEFKRDFTAIHIISTIVLLVFCLILFMWAESLSSLLRLSSKLLWFSLIISYTYIYNVMLLSYYRIKQKIWNYGIISCGNAIFVALLTLYLVIILEQGWEGKVNAQLCGSIVIAFLAVIVYHRKELIIFNGISISRLRTIILWGLPLIPHMAALWIRQGLDRYIIEEHYTMADVGLFSFALNLTNIIVILGSSFNNSFSIEQYQVLSSNNNYETKKNILIAKSKTMAKMFIAFTIVIVITCSIMVFFALPAYLKSLPYFWILSIYGLFQCFYFLVVNYLFYFKRNKEIMYTTFGTSILHLLLSLYFTRFSLYCTCIIYIIIQALIFIIILYRSKKVIVEELNK